MSTKLLTEAQARQLIREIIVWDELYEAGYLTEAGLWQKIKYKLGKLGSMEKGGTILGRGKASKEASAELQAIMDKAENATLKGFFDRLKEEHPEYPNQESQEDFVNALTEIGIFFASVHAAAAKKEGEEGYLPCQVANAIIDDLKKVVQKTLDYDLSDVYKHLTEQEKEELNELFGRPSREDRWAAIAAGEDDPAQKKATPRLTGKDSSTIKGLKSNLLPALLALGGASAGMAHILVNQPWFLELLTNPAKRKVITHTLKKILNVKSGEGPTQMLGRLMKANPGHYGPNVPVATMVQDMQAAGISPTHLAKLGRNPTSWLKNWNQMMASPEAGSQTLGQFFGPDAIQGLAWDPTAAGAGVEIGKTVTQTLAVGGGTAAASAAGTVAAASWATGVLGIGLLASAAAVKAIRIKGLKSSRAKGLNDLMNAFNPVDCDKGPGKGDECPEGQTRNPETGECEEKEGPEFNGPYEFPLLPVENMIIDFLEERGVEIDEGSLEDLVGSIEAWMKKNRERGADYFDIDPDSKFLTVKEQSAKGTGTYKGPEFEEEEAPSRRRYKTKNPNIAIKKNAGKSQRSVSFSTYLHRLFSIGDEQGRPDLLATVSPRDLRKLKKKLVSFVYDDLEKQGAPIQQQQQQQQQQEAQKRPTLQELNENKTVQRWKHLAGIKSE